MPIFALLVMTQSLSNCLNGPPDRGQQRGRDWKESAAEPDPTARERLDAQNRPCRDDTAAAAQQRLDRDLHGGVK